MFDEKMIFLYIGSMTIHLKFNGSQYLQALKAYFYERIKKTRNIVLNPFIKDASYVYYAGFELLIIHFILNLSQSK